MDGPNLQLPIKIQEPIQKILTSNNQSFIKYLKLQISAEVSSSGQ